MKEYYTPQEAAELLSVNKYLILRFINTGKLVASNLGTGQRSVYRISREEIDKFIKKSKNKKDDKQNRNTKD